VDKLLKYFPLVKIDEAAHMVWGVATSEKPDSDGEICDYDFCKAEMRKWSEDAFKKTTAAGQEPSLGNMRVMHQLEIGGKAIKITYDDEAKKIWVGSTPANDDVWNLLKGGFLTSHSIGGAYAWKRQEGEYVRFGPKIGEISYVDQGANSDAAFSYVKADGSTELRKFAKPGEKELAILKKLEAPTMLLDLSDEGLERLQKAIGSDMSTEFEKFAAEIRKIVVQTSAARGDAMKLTADQFKKAADALGISEEDFGKAIAANLVAPDALAKAQGGLAALHGHMEKAMEHHEAMHKAHTALGAMHEKHSGHLGKMMKAVKSLMGSDEKEAEKAIKALISDLKKFDTEPAPAPAPAPAPEKKDELATFGKAEVEAMLKKQKEESDAALEAAIKKALDSTPADYRPAALFKVTRDNDVKQREKVDQSDPLPV